MTWPRKRSVSGYHHVVLKANGDADLFCNDCDRERFLELTAKSKALTGIQILAFCLMTNHVHFLIFDPKEHLSQAVYEISFRYARYFNARYNRCGSVFKRFWSEPIETDSHLLAVVDYIHQNPEVAGMAKAYEYLWSSFSALAGMPVFKDIVDTKLVWGMLSGSRGFLRHSDRLNFSPRAFLQSRLRRHLLKEELSFVAGKILGEERFEGLHSLSRSERAKALALLKAQGFSRREIKLALSPAF